jgi:hypothetical protein
MYGLGVTTVASLYVYFIIRSARRLVPYQRQEVHKKRDRASIMYD